MMRLSAALTRRDAPAAGVAAEAEVAVGVTGAETGAETAGVLNEDSDAKWSVDEPLGGKLGIAGCNAGLEESSQDNIDISNE